MPDLTKTFAAPEWDCKASEMLQLVEMGAPSEKIDSALLESNPTTEIEPASTLIERLVRGEGALDEWQIAKAVFFGTKGLDEAAERAEALAQKGHGAALHCLGVGLLQAYVQANWTGPELEWTTEKICPAGVCENALEMLCADGEDAYSLQRAPELLTLALWLLCDVLAGDPAVPAAVALWWQLRALFVQQRILESPAGTLETRMMQIVDLLSQRHVDNLPSAALRSRLWTEFGLVHHFYRHDKRARACFERAQSESGLEWSLSGELGVRTRFQQNPVAQLVLKARSRIGGDAVSLVDAKPENVALQDDTLLEHVKFSSTQDESAPALWTGDQCLLLCYCLNVKNTNPDHGLTKEQMRPFVDRVLERSQNWSVYSLGLLLRSRLEKEHGRTVERALFQVRALVEQIPLQETAQPQRRSARAERLEWFFSLAVPSRWELERELGERFMSLGATASALEIFERLQLWDLCVSCLIMMDKRADAERLLERQLETTPNAPALLCTLGDLRQDAEMLRRAWTARPGRKFARAMRCLGALHYKRSEFAEAVTCYQAALEVNPLFEHAWFVLGCAAMRCENWDVAADAFQRCTQLDYENAEAWNNYSSVLLRQGRQADAFRALAQAVKHNFDNVRIWQNYLVIAVSSAEWAEAMRALEHLVETQYPKLKEGRKHECVDVEVLRVLVDVAIAGDSAHLPSPALLDAFLLRLSQKIASSADVFYHAARLFAHRQQWESALALSEKAFRVALNRIQTIPDRRAFEALCLVSRFAVELRLNPAAASPERDAAKMAYDARMLVRAVTSRTREHWGSDDPLIAELQALLGSNV